VAKELFDIMKIPLLCHRNGDDDIARAWLEYYTAIGVSSFHIVLHGDDSANRRFLELRSEFPIIVHSAYDGPFDEREKIRRLNAILPAVVGKWILVVDSDEFVEFPCTSLAETIRELERCRSLCLAAPLLQRIRADGSLESADEVADAFVEFPLCSVLLNQLMGALPGSVWTSKYPLFYCDSATELQFGNHIPASGEQLTDLDLRGVSHHFKWRRSVFDRLRLGAVRLPYGRPEAVQYMSYLRAHRSRVPLDDAFRYSRAELIRRRLLVAQHRDGAHGPQA
jgi:Glycosyl transferase family 2